MSENYRYGQPISATEQGHADGCTALPILSDDEPEPVAYIAHCIEGCRHRERAIEHGRELAARYGW